MKVETLIVLLLTEALYWRVRYEESNPDIGMGPSNESLLEDIGNDIGAPIPKHVRNIVLANYERMYGR